MFHCLKCNAPLQIDPTLHDASASQLKLLTQSRKAVPETSVSLEPKDFIPHDRLRLLQLVDPSQEPFHFLDTIEEHTTDSLPDQRSLPDASLVVNGEDVEEAVPVLAPTPDSVSENEVPNPISGRIHTLEKIFEVLSNQGDVRHPMCGECAELLIENYKLKFDQNQREKDQYMTFLKKLKLKDDSDVKELDLDTKLRESIDECRKLETEERELLNELRDLERKKEELSTQLAAVKQDLALQQQTELHNALKLKNELHWTLQSKTDLLAQEHARYRVVLNKLDGLRNLNMYTRFFDIDADDQFGKINGFRLGYRVPWLEVNCALGQLVLLAVFLCKRLNVQLKKYKLVPMGSQSYIVNTVHDGKDGSKTVLNLFLSNEISLGKLLNFNKLNVSMIALLDVLSQIEATVLSLDSEIELPYTISPKKDVIGGKSIRVTSNTEWTYSCKFLLVNFKWILTYVSSRG